jgi:hypothetical protein
MPNTGNTQQQINYGAEPNDGQGDPLRTAFIKTDENFDNIWLAGPVGSNITITNNTIAVNNTNGNLILAPNATGIIQTRGSLQSYANNIHYLGTANLRYLGGYFGPAGLDVAGNVTAANITTGSLNVDTLSTSGLTVNGDAQITGNLRVQGDIIQVGNIVTDTLTIQLANTAANGAQANGAGITVGANDDIAALLYDSGSNVWTTNIGVAVNSGISSTTLSVDDGAGNSWTFLEDSLLAPSGGKWRSDASTLDDYITSAANGFINLQSLYADGNIASELHLEHGTAHIRIADGPFVDWYFRNTGNLEAPGNIITPADVTANSFIGDGSQLTGITVVAGSNTQVQFNDDGALGADPDFYFVKATNTLVVNGELNEHSVELGAQGFTDLNSNVIAQVTGNANSYTQINFQNINSGPAATTDYVATAAFGTDSTFFVNMGIASNAYDNLNPNNSLGTSLYPQDSYLYSQGGNSPGGSGGNLVIGSNEPGGVVRVIADGSNDANIVATFSNTGIDVKGDIIPVANSVYSLGNVTNQWANLWVANNTIYIGGVPVGIGAGNVLTVNGEAVLSNDSDTTIVTTGNVTANYFIGDGSLLTGLPASYGNANVATFLADFGSNTISTTGNITAGNLIGNISITGNVTGTSANVTLIAGGYSTTFDNAGTATFPGNLVAGGGGIINKASGFVNAGTFVTLDNIKAALTASGNRGLSLATVTGSITVNISATYGGFGGPGGAAANNLTYTTTPSTSIFDWNFGFEGEASTYTISDITNGLAYRITLQIGPSFNSNFISIERL